MDNLRSSVIGVYRIVIQSLLPSIAALTILVVAWGLWVELGSVPEYIVPSPSAVLDRLVGNPGFFFYHGFITLIEALGGFLLGATVAILGATVMVHSRFVERTLLPLALLVKVTPIVAIAPLFVIWFGFGSAPKILIAALITFFPVMVNAFTGFRSINSDVLNFFRSVSATKSQIYFKLRVPSSLPYLFAAFRIAVPLSVIGAVVGEWFSGDRGLGSVIIIAHNNLDMPTLFSAILILAATGVSLTVLVSYLERRLLFWHEIGVIS